MPFKGDRRLGGPHDNESSLDGTSEGPSFPPAGQFLYLVDEEYPAAFGGTQVNISEDSTTQVLHPNQVATFNVVTDGAGGVSTDYYSATNARYKYDETIIVDNVTTATIYLDFNGTPYDNGYQTVGKCHDGAGGWRFINTGSPTYTTTSVFLEESVPVNYILDGNTYQVGNATRRYSHNGYGGFTYADFNTVYFYEGYYISTVTGENTVFIGPEVGGQSYVVGNWAANVVSNGLGSAYYNNGSSYYYPEGTFIVQREGLNHYSDGAGGYYSVSAFAPYGTPTGNVTPSTNYISINGNNYPNGTCNVVEYHNGEGGFYTALTDFSYAPEWTLLYQQESTDDVGNTTYVSYYSNGTGGYYN
jgi:hypothetical protein